MKTSYYVFPVVADARLNSALERLRRTIRRGDIILFYPKTLHIRQLVTHFYQNHHGFQYLDSLCTHAAIFLGEHNVIDSTPERGVSIRPLKGVCADRIVRVRRLTHLSPDQIAAFVTSAETLEGCDYNMFGIVGGASGLATVLRRIRSAALSVMSAPTDAVSEDEAEAVHSFYCSQLVEYCYTRITRRTFGDVRICEVFPPSALSLTRELKDVPIAEEDIVETDQAHLQSVFPPL